MRTVNHGTAFTDWLERCESSGNYIPSIIFTLTLLYFTLLGCNVIELAMNR